MAHEIETHEQEEQEIIVDSCNQENYISYDNYIAFFEQLENVSNN